MNDAINPKVAAEKARDTYRKTARRKTTPKVGTGKAHRTDRKTASKAVAEKARGTYRKTAAVVKWITILLHIKNAPDQKN